MEDEGEWEEYTIGSGLDYFSTLSLKEQEAIVKFRGRVLAEKLIDFETPKDTYVEVKGIDIFPKKPLRVDLKCVSNIEQHVVNQEANFQQTEPQYMLYTFLEENMKVERKDKTVNNLTRTVREEGAWRVQIDAQDDVWILQPIDSCKAKFPAKIKPDMFVSHENQGFLGARSEMSRCVGGNLASDSQGMVYIDFKGNVIYQKWNDVIVKGEFVDASGFISIKPGRNVISAKLCEDYILIANSYRETTLTAYSRDTGDFIRDVNFGDMHQQATAMSCTKYYTVVALANKMLFSGGIKSPDIELFLFLNKNLRKLDHKNAEVIERKINRIHKPITAFFIYCQERRNIVRQERPDFTMVELTRVIAEEWKNLSEEGKSDYVKRAQILKDEYLNKLNSIPLEDKQEFRNVLTISGNPIRKIDFLKGTKREQPRIMIVQFYKAIIQTWGIFKDSIFMADTISLPRQTHPFVVVSATKRKNGFYVFTESSVLRVFKVRFP